MRKAKSYLKRIISVFLMALIVLMFMSLTQTRFDHNNIRVSGLFMEEKNSLDVILLGASEAYSGYSPVRAYQKEEITSYVFAVEDNPIKIYPSEIEEIRAYQKPKLFLIEISGASSERNLKPNVFDATLRKYSDSVPLSMNKYHTVSKFGLDGDKISYFVPFVIYHGKMPSLDLVEEQVSLFQRGYTYSKGTVARTKTIEPDGDIIDVTGDLSKSEPDKDILTAFDSLLDYCKTITDSKVVFVRMPHRITNDKNYLKFREGNYISDSIKNNGFDYIDFEQMKSQLGLDYNNDFADNDHLNASGHLKLTDYLCDRIVNDYHVQPEALSDKSQNRWNNSVKFMEKFYMYYEEKRNGGADLFLYENKDLVSFLQQRMK